LNFRSPKMIRILDLLGLFQCRDYQCTEKQKFVIMYTDTETGITAKEDFAKMWFSLKKHQLDDFPDLSIRSYNLLNIPLEYDVVVYDDKCIQSAEYDIPIKIHVQMDYVKIEKDHGLMMNVPKMTITQNGHDR
jgi:hypothetical protein